MSRFLHREDQPERRIIAFGGVFDPVHNGHIAAAKKALALTQAEKVIFLPERAPYRKHFCSAYEHRLKMLEVALESEPQLEVLDYPYDRQTITGVFGWVAEKFPGAQFVWLLGVDSYRLLAGWENADSLQNLHVDEVIVARRENAEQSDGSLLLQGVPVQFIATNYAQVSSSKIRQNPQDTRADLPERVYDYVQSHKLYA